ncbi:unnamed protein product [Dicrocoelium dendriticum]|nr:unnamed protein product [Dicrocoelium dendriticum]
MFKMNKLSLIILSCAVCVHLAYSLKGTDSISHTIPQPRVYWSTIIRQMSTAKTDDEFELYKRKLHRAIQRESLAKSDMEEIARHVEQAYASTRHDISKEDYLKCVEDVFEAFQRKCFTFAQHPIISRHSWILSNLCQKGYETGSVVQAVYEVCA